MQEFFDLEEGLLPEDFSLDGKSVWPVLRIYFFYALRDQRFGKTRSSFKWSPMFALKVAFRVIVSIANVFRPVGVLFVSNSIENKDIEGKNTNKLLFPFFSKLSAEDALYLERPTTGVSLTREGNPPVISTLLFDVVAFVFRYFVFIDKDLLRKLNAVAANAEIQVNVKALIGRYIVYRKLLNLFLKVKAPKLIVVTQYYNLMNMALCEVAKELKIKTVEIQHGVINSNHPAYCRAGQFDLYPVPDILGSFGAFEVELFNSVQSVYKGRAVPIGHAYIDHLVQKSESEPGSQPEPKYDVAVTLQYTTEKETIKWIEKVARLRPSIKYLLLPRTPLEASAIDSLPSNVLVSRDLDFYASMRVSRVHATNYSTCVLEAPSFGVPTILLDYNGMARSYYEEYSFPEEIVKYATTEDEFLAAYDLLTSSSKNKIQSAGQYFIKPGFSSNIDQILELG